VSSGRDVLSNVELMNVAADAAADDKTPAAVNDISQAAVDVSAAVNRNIGHGSSVALGLSSGHFDVANVKLLRTCSEPDLSRLTQSAPITPHKSDRDSDEGHLTERHSNNCVRDDFTANVVSHISSPSLQLYTDTTLNIHSNSVRENCHIDMC